jgi:hypothetical protein
MSRSAFSAKVFAIYLFILGPVLLVAPNVLLALFRLPGTSEVWIRVIGLLAVNIGVFMWIAARHEYRHVFVASVITRCVVFVALAALAVLGLASPIIIVFGVLDLLGGLWTWVALKADASRSPR